MRSEKIKKKKRKIKYYEAPAKSRASYFFTAFFLTFALIVFAIGFFIADRNSQRLGWGQDSQVFAVTNSGNNIGVTVMGNDYTIDTGCLNGAKAALGKAGQVEAYLEPEPVRLAEIALRQLHSYEEELLSRLNFRSSL
jgi:hypothetical protein